MSVLSPIVGALLFAAVAVPLLALYFLRLRRARLRLRLCFCVSLRCSLRARLRGSGWTGPDWQAASVCVRVCRVFVRVRAQQVRETAVIELREGDADARVRRREGGRE